MFGIGHFPELMIVLVIALIVVGPSKLPEMGRSVGRAIRGFRETSAELERTFSGAFLDTPPPPTDGVPLAEPVAADFPASSIPTYTSPAAADTLDHAPATVGAEGASAQATHATTEAVSLGAASDAPVWSKSTSTSPETAANNDMPQHATTHPIESPTMFSAHVPTSADIAPTHSEAAPLADPPTSQNAPASAQPAIPAHSTETFLASGSHPRQRVRRIVLPTSSSTSTAPSLTTKTDELTRETTAEPVASVAPEHTIEFRGTD